MTHPSVLWKYQEYHIVHLSNRRRQDSYDVRLQSLCSGGRGRIVDRGTTESYTAPGIDYWG